MGGRLSYGLSVLLNFYNGLVFFYCILTWIPNVDWEKQPAKFLNAIVAPLLNLFRGVIPPVGGLDFSPMIALFLLIFCGNFIISFLAGMGL